MRFHPLFALPSVVLVLAWPVHAKTPAQELEYESVFEGYQAYSDPEIQNWPKVNQLVEEIGGWSVYAREPYEEKKEGKPTGGSSVDAERPPATKPPAPTPHHHGGAR